MRRRDRKLEEGWPFRLSVRTPGFHPGKRGSIPLGATPRLCCSDGSSREQQSLVLKRKKIVLEAKRKW